MDHELIALVGMIVATVAVGMQLGVWGWPTRPGRSHQQVFSTAAAGLFLFIAGLMGWDLSHSHGVFEGTRWVEGAVWWQVILGLGLLLLAGFWVRRMPPP